jgi:hypothetical protein
MECMSASIVMGPTDHGYGDKQTRHRRRSRVVDAFLLLIWLGYVRALESPGYIQSIILDRDFITIVCLILKSLRFPLKYLSTLSRSQLRMDDKFMDSLRSFSMQDVLEEVKNRQLTSTL